MNTAVADDLIVANPCRVRGAGVTKRVKKIRPASLAELEAIATTVPGKYKVLILLAAWCALRFGELTELRRSDVDLKTGTLHVRRSVVTTNTGRLVKDLADVPPAQVILLDLTPRQLLAVGGGRLPSRYSRRLRGYQYGPGVFKLDWALAGPVPWRDPAVGGAATVHLGGTLGEIAAAEGEVAAGRHPERPYVLTVQPCAADPSRAPAGKHVLWAYCHVPYANDEDRTAEIERQIERFAPGFGDCIEARATSPASQLAGWNPNLAGGDISGGAMSLWQMLLRPTIPSYRTPLPNVFLCSSSTPPGAGVHGMCGANAAECALKFLKADSR